ncbi:MAG: aminodeoxychorismate synthase component I [Steroidobacteraceae bacterium]
MTHVRELDAPPAVLRRLAAGQPERYPVLLESVAPGPLGRVSLLLGLPRAALWLDRESCLGASPGVPCEGGFLDSLEQWWLAERAALPIDTVTDVPFTGGWAVFLGYEIAQEIEPRLELPAAAQPWRAFALRTPCALAHIPGTHRVLAIAEPGAERELAELQRDVEEAACAEPRVENGPERALSFSVREEEPERHLERVRRAKEYIRAGDIYQANLSRPWEAVALGSGGAHAAVSPALTAGDLYARLAAANPAPFAALAQWGGVSVVSSSPERLIRVSGRDVETRPIAGTRPRTRRPGVDAEEAAALIAHPKERAEHIMLIDLERNDLGRVCEAGSVCVDELMATETYAHVHHIVSNVRGRLRPDVTPVGAMRAVFPGGTITGVPKFRCMQIIAELEGAGRGAYTGALGYLTASGALDLNILIRTLTMSEGRIAFRAGGGIVADSDPERELEETRAKARGLLAALGSSSR